MSPTAKRPGRRRATSTPKKTTRRGKGRPPANGLAVGRDALIAKTCELLMRFPADQVTPTAVARAMRVDRTLIRYYFLNREALLLAAVEQLTTTHFLSLVKAETEASGSTPAGQLRARISALLDLEVKYPFFSRLITDELAQMKSKAARKLLQQLTVRGLAGYRDILMKGFEDGTFRRADPALLFLAIVGACQDFVTRASVVSLALGDSTQELPMSVRYREFICELMLRYLEP